MAVSEALLILLMCIFVSVFFSVSEISLAASRKVKLQMLAETGSIRAQKVLNLQAASGKFFTLIQIGINTVAILAGVVSESALSHLFIPLLGYVYQGQYLEGLASTLSFVMVTLSFIIFADLMPKRLAMAYPEQIALAIVIPIERLIVIFTPAVWVINGLANLFFKLLGFSTVRNDQMTSDELYAAVDASVEAGIIQKEEHEVIGNVMEMQLLGVTAAMTARDSLVYFFINEPEESIRQKIKESPHNRFLVCDNALDNVVGYVDSKDLLIRLLNQEPLKLSESSLSNLVVIPDTLTLFETMEYFKKTRSEFAVVMNEYALVVGVVTINDLMTSVMGDWAAHSFEEQIVQRDESSWLVDGGTPISDVMRVLSIAEFPDAQYYETMAGFMMYRLRKIPKRTDFVNFSGYKFEVVDIDHHKIDQLLVTRLEEESDKPTSL
ncbi:MAG: HlyC/CorC family transporter [Thiotrichales bacterium]|nr:HlyC/CorC family transporter [Thiotrichales bacterium]